MLTSEFLIAAKALIADPDDWIQGAASRRHPTKPCGTKPSLLKKESLAA